MADYILIDEGATTKIAADQVSRGGDLVNRQQVGLDVSAEAEGALTNATSTAYEASHVVKASPGRVYRIDVYSSLGSAQWIQLYNSTTLPANGVAPAAIIKIATIASVTWDFGPYGRYFSTGIVIGNSTTGPTKTIGAADTWFDVQYV